MAEPNTGHTLNEAFGTCNYLTNQRAAQVSSQALMDAPGITAEARSVFDRLQVLSFAMQGSDTGTSSLHPLGADLAAVSEALEAGDYLLALERMRYLADTIRAAAIARGA